MGVTIVLTPLERYFPLLSIIDHWVVPGSTKGVHGSTGLLSQGAAMGGFRRRKTCPASANLSVPTMTRRQPPRRLYQPALTLTHPHRHGPGSLGPPLRQPILIELIEAGQAFNACGTSTSTRVGIMRHCSRTRARNLSSSRRWHAAARLPPIPHANPLRFLIVEGAWLRQSCILGVVAIDTAGDEHDIAAAQAEQIPLRDPALDVLPHGPRAGPLRWR
jgi:hypothetical protein